MTIAGRDALVAIEPFVDCLLDRHLTATREWFPHDYVPWERGRSLTDEPWSPTNSPLTAPARTALELDLLTEDDLLSFHLVLWDVVAGLGAWGGWIRRWTAEEARHSIAIRDYLLVSRVARSGRARTRAHGALVATRGPTPPRGAFRQPRLRDAPGARDARRSLQH